MFLTAYLVELFPFHVRAKGISIYQWFGRGGGFIGQFVNPIGIDLAGMAVCLVHSCNSNKTGEGQQAGDGTSCKLSFVDAMRVLKYVKLLCVECFPDRVRVHHVSRDIGTHARGADIL